MLAVYAEARYSNGVAFHLSYDREEDRILIAVDLDAGQRYGMALTRRLAKLVLGALADYAGKHSAGSTHADPQQRDTVLTFEHASAVEAALASGQTKTHQPRKPFVQPALLVREVKLTPKDEGIAMVLFDRNRVLTLDLSPTRMHNFMAGLIELSAGAGWDLPRIAAWLDRAKAGEPAGAPRVLH